MTFEGTPHATGLIWLSAVLSFSYSHSVFQQKNAFLVSLRYGCGRDQSVLWDCFSSPGGELLTQTLANNSNRCYWGWYWRSSVQIRGAMSSITPRKYSCYKISLLWSIKIIRTKNSSHRRCSFVFNALHSICASTTTNVPQNLHICYFYRYRSCNSSFKVFCLLSSHVFLVWSTWQFGN